jgi:ankyrin repeat protein
MGSDSEKLLKAFERVPGEFNLCPHRVWAVARENLPKLVPDGNSIPGHDKCEKREEHKNHELCTFDFCEYSQRDFTAVKQRHECKEDDCVQLQGLFSRETLKNAAENGRSTVWSLDGRSMIEPPLPYMAISHVWSDGTGTGAWRDGEVNECLYGFFQRIAKQFQCDGIWWDTLCIPKEKAARNKAIRKIQSNYEDARITLVHDCFLRNWNWDHKTACFAILMSPWFSRGWTALELAKSRKVKVIFKGPCGLLIKDLDEQILAKEGELDGPHKEASQVIKNLRKGITTLNDLLTVLGPRHTSWPKDMAIISGLLVGVAVAPKDPQQDIWQQDIYKTILRKIGRVSCGHLFHNATTMSKGFNWCPTSLFTMPWDSSKDFLTILENGDIEGEWRLIRVDDTLEKNCSWSGTHPLIKAQLQDAIRYPDKCVLLAECDTQSVGRALVVKVMGTKGISETPCCQYVGAVYFRQELTKRKDVDDWIPMKVIVLGDRDEKVTPAGSAWELVKKVQRPMGVEHSHHLDEKTGGGGSEASSNTQTTEEDGDRTGGGENRSYSNAEAMKGEHGQAHSDSEISPLISAASTGDEKTVNELLPTVDPNVKEPVSRRTALHYAIWRGYHGVFSKLIEKVDPDVPDGLEQQPLHLAGERGDKEMVSRLLDKAQTKAKKEDILGARCENGQTALHRAAWGGSAEVVSLLLEEGANANTEDYDGNTGLHIAAEKGFESVVALLLDNGNVNAKGRNGLTPLYYAVMGGHNEVVELLVHKGADVNAKDNKIGWTPLHCAAGNGQEPVVKLLLDNNADVNAKDNKIGWTPLHFAAMKRHEAVVKLLVEKGAELESEDNKGWTPLRFAAENGDEAVVKLLVDKGAELESKDGEIGWTPLHCAAMDEQQGVVGLLVDKGADINAKDKDDGTPLHWAAGEGQQGVVKLLVDKGADVNVGDRDDRTPLYWAAEKGQQGVVKLLVDKGADVNVGDRDDRTPLYWAAGEGHEGVVKLLVDKGADVNVGDRDDRTPLYWAAEKGHEGMVKLLVDKGADVNARDGSLQGRTLLCRAAEEGHEGVVKLLVDKGADVNTGDGSLRGWMPLYRAAEKGHEGVVKLLVDKGADVNVRARDAWGRTPLYRAAEEGHEGVVKLLVDKGADVNVRDRFADWTPLYRAAEKGHEGVVKLLVDKGAVVNAKEQEQRRPDAAV